MIEVIFRSDTFGVPPAATRAIVADEVSLYEGWATFSNYVAVEGEKYKESVFVEAIRLEKIESLKRVDP